VACDHLSTKALQDVATRERRLCGSNYRDNKKCKYHLGQRIEILYEEACWSAFTLKVFSTTSLQLHTPYPFLVSAHHVSSQPARQHRLTCSDAKGIHGFSYGVDG
jgi:hypothetical protein